jgi:hypothetical protein
MASAMNPWKQIGDKFKTLMEEEDLLARERILGERCYVYVACGQSGESSWAEGFATESFQARFELVATEAGVALGCPPGTSPETYWLNRLRLELIATDSDFSHMYDGANGVIERLFEASNIFCLRLDRRELEKTLIPEDGADSSATHASFAGENTEKGALGLAPVRDRLLELLAMIVNRKAITLEAWASDHKLGRTTLFDWKASRSSGKSFKGRVSTEKSAEIEAAIEADAAELGLTTRTDSD